MKQTQPLRMNYEFSRVYQKGRYVSGRYVVLHYLKRNGQVNRLGITASRKVNGSVRRNRIKRVLRASYQLIEDQVRPGYDLILVGRHQAELKKRDQVHPEVKRLFKKAGLLSSENRREAVSIHSGEDT